MASNLQVLFRNSRIRSSVIFVVACVFIFTLYFLHSKHSQFQNLNELHSKCLQSKDTLSAQLQVAHEHRSRVEKFLEKEKKLVKDTKESLEMQNMELERSCKRDKTDIQFKLDQVLKSHEETQAQLSSAQEELKQFELKYQEEITKLRSEKETEVSRIQNQLDELINLREHQDKEISQVNFKNKKLEDELEQCQYILKQAPDHQAIKATKVSITEPSVISNVTQNNISKLNVISSLESKHNTTIQSFFFPSTTGIRSLDKKIANERLVETTLSDKVENSEASRFIQKKQDEQSVPSPNKVEEMIKEVSQAPALIKPFVKEAEKHIKSPSEPQLNNMRHNIPLPLPQQLKEKPAPLVETHPNIPPPRDPENNFGNNNNLLGDGSKNDQIHPPMKIDLDQKEDEKGYPHAPEDDIEEDQDDEGHLALPNGKQLHPFHDFDDQSQDNYNKIERQQPVRPDSVLAAP